MSVDFPEPFLPVTSRVVLDPRVKEILSNTTLRLKTFFRFLASSRMLTSVS
jgi:hypothetical protein